MDVTLSVIKADTGGFVGHTDVHPAMMDEARARTERAARDGLLLDGHVNRVGDDLALILTHERGPNDGEVHGFAWDVFRATTEVATRLGLYGAGQDLLSDAFSGTLRGLGPGYAEMPLSERPSEPIVVFLADKTEPGAFNYPLARMFADPYTTAGLVIDSAMHTGSTSRCSTCTRTRRSSCRPPRTPTTC